MDFISVCICTFSRPVLLGRLLDALGAQRASDDFSFEIIVVDNDLNRSAEKTVDEFQTRASCPVIYDCEPEQSISLARNRAVKRASGNLIAFIDDDERPIDGWLATLYETLNRQVTDGVIGPVVPDLPADAPAWIARGRFLDRRRHPTGTPLTGRDCRTGNVLLRRELFAPNQVWFDPKFGRSGGEDSDFFARQLRRGRKFVWCDEAIALEAVPRQRLTQSYLLRRRLLIGTITGTSLRGRTAAGWSIGKNAAILLACIVLAVPGFLLPVHKRLPILLKACYCAGFLSGWCGYPLTESRPSSMAADMELVPFPARRGNS